MQKEPKNNALKKQTVRKSAPPRTPADQENLMINLSMNQAQKMLQEGRAPAQIVVHFLKLATEKAKLENEKLKAETEMSRSKAEMLQSQKRTEELYQQAVNAFRSYGGSKTNDSYDEDDDYD